MRTLRTFCLAVSAACLSLAIAATTDPALAGQKNKHKNRSTFGPAHMIPSHDKPKGPLKGDINADFSPAMPHKRVTGGGGGGKHKIRSGRQGGGRNLDAAGAIIDMLGTAAGIAGGGSHQ
jgi:hypothetical protein